MVLRYLFYISMLLFTDTVSGQPDIVFRHINTTNGLSDNNVTNTVIDHHGFLWICTTEGLNRFDGRTMVNYFKEDYPELRNNNIREIVCDDRNRLWIRTFGGYISMLDEKRKWHAIHIYENGTERKIYDIVKTKSKGIILFFGGAQYRLKEGSDTLFERWRFPGDTLFNRRLYYKDRVGEDELLWITENELFVMNYALGKITFHLNVPGITSATKHNHNEFFITTRQNGGLFTYNKSTGQLKSLQYLKDQYGSPIFSNLQMIRRMPDGRFIISSDFAGLYIYNPSNDHLTRYVHDPLNSRSISSNNYYALIPDTSGYVFVTSVNNGLSYFNINEKPATWISYFKSDKNELFDGYVNAIIPADEQGSFWLGCYNQLIKWNRHKPASEFHEYGSFEGRPNKGNDEVLALAKDVKGNIWLGTGKSGLVILSAQGKLIRQLNNLSQPNSRLPGNTVNHILTRGTYMYVSTENGLCRVDISSLHVIPFKEKSALHSLTDIPVQLSWQDSRGRLWIGAGRAGAYCFDTTTNSMTNHARSNQWASNYIYSFNEDASQNIYIGTRAGLWVVEKSGKEIIYNRNNGLKSDGCENILKSKDGMLWLENGNNIIKFDPLHTSFSYFDETAGLSPYGFKVRSGYVDDNGLLYVGSDKGLCYFHPDSMHETKTALKLSVSQVSVENRKYDVTDPETLYFEHRDNDLSFHIAAIDLSMPRNIVFRYKLNGYDKTWQTAANLNDVRYSALRPGNYQFDIKASSDGQHWVDAIYPVKIDIKPAFWQTWWFRLIAAFTVAILFYVMLRARVAQIEKRAEEKARSEEMKAQALQYQLEIEQVISYFATSLSSLHTVNDVLWDVVKTCISQLGFEDCVLYLYNDRKTVLEQRAAYGPKNIDYRDIFNRLEIEAGSGIVGSVAVTGVPEIINDTRLDERYIPDDAVRLSEIAVPIMSSEGVIGVIDSEHPQVNFYTNRHLQILIAIATMVGNKIEQLEAETAKKQRETELARLQVDVATSQLTATRAQMNPHFIFNALNSVQQYILQGNSDDANRYLSRFSRLQREILNHCDRPDISLQKEIDMLQMYLELEQLRFNGSFEFSITASPDMDPEEIRIPPMVLQPFVENAIWHGLMPKADNRRVSIYFSLDEHNDDNLHCVIEDNGIGRKASADLKNADNDKPKHVSKGLDLVFKRLQLMEQQSGRTFKVSVNDIVDEEGNIAGTSVELILSTLS